MPPVRATQGLKWGVGAVALVAAALVPLYGDPRVSRVSHPEWARMLLEGLDLAEALPRSSSASLVFSVLSWKTNMTQSAERYVRADGMELVNDPQRLLRAVADPGEAAYALAVARAGDYRVRARLGGGTATPAVVELARAGEEGRAYEFSVRPPQQTGWVDVGVAHLAPGAWTASVSMPQGAALESIEIAPPCLSPIEPLGGWKAPRVTDTVDLSVTVVKALDLESELPPGDTPIDIPAHDFRSEEPQALNVARPVDGYVIAGGERGLRVEVSAEAPEAGLYTLSFFGLRGQGQRWSADGCHKVIVCSEPEPARVPGWHVLGTLDLAAGRHLFTIALGPGATIERLRLERRKQAGEDYVATLRRLGFDPGPEGPVTRQKAEEAIDFLRGRRHERPTPDCGDWDLPPQGDVTRVDGGYPGGGGPPGPPPGPPPPPGNPGGGPPPNTPPGVPPQDPASPVLP
jgi:hypothetical protein